MSLQYSGVHDGHLYPKCRVGCYRLRRRRQGYRGVESPGSVQHKNRHRPHRPMILRRQPSIIYTAVYGLMKRLELCLHLYSCHHRSRRRHPTNRQPRSRHRPNHQPRSLHHHRSQHRHTLRQCHQTAFPASGETKCHRTGADTQRCDAAGRIWNRQDDCPAAREKNHLRCNPRGTKNSRAECLRLCLRLMTRQMRCHHLHRLRLF
mmetsp:Transcript_6659/g.14627  ORF Transcript_6659/g.14627 Transcript_6659/m.14627 type:complete len:205 (-) Transcript_6659:1008-1622(-)